MKLSFLQQSYLTRRANSFRGSSQLDSSGDASVKSPSAILWLILNTICCLISLVLGFRFSRLVFFFLLSTSSVNLNSVPHFRTASDITAALDIGQASTSNVPFSDYRATADGVATSSSRVVVGRHGIRVRPWPHPDPIEVMKAHRIIERVQGEQRFLFGVKNPRKLIVVTPTYVRTFQALHLTGVMHSLMLVPYDLVWIVVEAGGVTNETATIITKSKLRTVHVGFDQEMPTTWEGRHRLESKMRFHALRTIREQKLEGIVMFADDSNMHSLELFDEIQNVKWVGAVSVGILVHSARPDESSSQREHSGDETAKTAPVQGPACNSSDNLVGWHPFNTTPYVGKSAVQIDDRATVLPQKLEWAGFVLNSRLLWKDADDKPEWMKSLDALDDETVESPLSLLKDPSVVEPLGSCGREVLVWWLRAEARTDSRFPPRWIIDPPLNITVSSKRTPWPDALPELPVNGKESVTDTQGHAVIVKQSTKTRSSKSKRRSKRNREAKVAEHVSTRQSQQN